MYYFFFRKYAFYFRKMLKYAYQFLNGLIIQKYAIFNFAYQHISLRFKFIAYLTTFWTVKKKICKCI